MMRRSTPSIGIEGKKKKNHIFQAPDDMNCKLCVDAQPDFEIYSGINVSDSTNIYESVYYNFKKQGKKLRVFSNDFVFFYSLIFIRKEERKRKIDWDGKTSNRITCENGYQRSINCIQSFYFEMRMIVTLKQGDSLVWPTMANDNK